MRTTDAEDKALIRSQIKCIQREMRDASVNNFLDSKVRVVITTAFKATTLLKRPEIKADIEAGFTPFTTILIDEAGYCHERLFPRSRCSRAGASSW